MTSLRLIQVGAGAMGRTWLHAIANSPEVELVGLVDLDLELAQRVSEEELAAVVPVARSLSELVDLVGADAVVNVTVPAAHNAVNEEALRAGLPVICEKPIAPTVAEAQQIAAVAKETGKLLMISQSRRYLNQFTALREGVAELGPIASVSCEFGKAAASPISTQLPRVGFVIQRCAPSNVAKIPCGANLSSHSPGIPISWK